MFHYYDRKYLSIGDRPSNSYEKLDWENMKFSNSFSHILILFIFFFHSLFLQFHSFPPVFTQFLFLALSYLYSSLHQIQIFFSLSSLSYYFSEMLSFIYPFLHFPLSLSFFVPLYLFIPFLSFLLSLASNELNLCTHPFHHHCVLFPPVSCY
ncbi:unnamed protein product [Acanthosepion pharaonis]|uniref:Uncharacterized protein n=1 Tax=Acanthosepion pharaonis TaxID=158019 RepID=A0A812C854_ACAPH|nr:unnamed protein product [Sepia pharaonis]